MLSYNSSIHYISTYYIYLSRFKVRFNITNHLKSTYHDYIEIKKINIKKDESYLIKIQYRRKHINILTTLCLILSRYHTLNIIKR